MGDNSIHPTVRVLTATANHGRSRVLEELATVLAEEVKHANYRHVRHVTVKGEREFIQTLLTQVALDNEADVIIIVGGTGFGPGDNMMEGLEGVFDRKIEGFAGAYRHLLRDGVGAETHDPNYKAGVRAMLARATAGVYNECVAFAFSGNPNEVRAALKTIVLPALPEAVARATGRGKQVATSIAP